MVWYSRTQDQCSPLETPKRVSTIQGSTRNLKSRASLKGEGVFQKSTIWETRGLLMAPLTSGRRCYLVNTNISTHRKPTWFFNLFTQSQWKNQNNRFSIHDTFWLNFYAKIQFSIEKVYSIRVWKEELSVIFTA